MIDEIRKFQAQRNVAQYVREGLLKKEHNELAKTKYVENATQSLQVAAALMEHPLKPYLWVIVTAYYSMFYMANAVLLQYGYKTQDKIAHKVTREALVALVMDKLKKELVEEYEDTQQDALEIAATKAEELIEGYEHELAKRSRFQYAMSEEVKENKARTSLERAQRFRFALLKLLVK